MAKEVSWMHLEVKVEEVLWEVLEVTDQENKILHVADKHVENVLYSKVKTLIKMGIKLIFASIFPCLSI